METLEKEKEIAPAEVRSVVLVFKSPDKLLDTSIASEGNKTLILSSCSVARGSALCKYAILWFSPTSYLNLSINTCKSPFGTLEVLTVCSLTLKAPVFNKPAGILTCSLAILFAFAPRASTFSATRAVFLSNKILIDELPYFVISISPILYRKSLLMPIGTSKVLGATLISSAVL